MSDTSYKIWCFIEGDNSGTPFPVVASSTTFIASLKRKIKQKRSIVLQGFDAGSLILWKPLGVILVEPRDTLASRIRDLGPDISQFARELDQADLVAFQNQNPTPLRLDVIVEVVASASVLGKRFRADDDWILPDLPWLEEVHSKIWNRKDLKPQLFREVKVTREDYVALQECLKELNPDRDSPDYEGGSLVDVGNVKLDFLQSLTPAKDSPPQHPDDNDNQVDDDDSEEDDPVIKKLFPSVLKFLDLSTLKLKEMIPYRLPLPLLLRQDYDDISELIKKRPCSVIISGQPGTGKTAYLHLRMIENMIEGCPFLYQAKEGVVYHVDKKGVEVVHSWSSRDMIVAFIDGDKGDYEPKGFLMRESVQLIVASSPKGVYRKWTKHMFIFKLAVKLWSLNELLLTGLVLALLPLTLVRLMPLIFLIHSDISLKLLRESTSYFGYNPRRCFRASVSADNLHYAVIETASEIRSTAKDMGKNIARMLHDTQRGGNPNISHTIFQIFPTNTNTHRLLSECHHEPVSRWALDISLSEYEAYQAYEIADFRLKVSAMRGTASLQGHTSERQVLNHLSDIPIEHSSPIRGLIAPVPQTRAPERLDEKARKGKGKDRYAGEDDTIPKKK